MTSSQKIHIPYDKQKNDYFCGPASLEMAFDYFQRHVSQKTLAREGRTDAKVGTTRENMIRVAAENGFYAYVNNNSDIAEIGIFLERKLPVIVNFTEPSDEEGHYSIVSGISKSHITLNDPWNGKNFTMTVDEFLQRWHSGGHSHKWLLVVSKEDLNLGKQYRPQNI